MLGQVVRIRFEGFPDSVIMAGPGETGTLPGADPRSTPREVWVLESGRLVQKVLRTPEPPSKSLPPGTIQNGLYYFCDGRLSNAPIVDWCAPGWKKPVASGMYYGKWWPANCPVPRGSSFALVCDHWGKVLDAQKAEMGAQAAYRVGKKVAGIIGRNVRKAIHGDIRAQMKLIKYHIQGVTLPPVVRESIGAAVKHFKENPEALALFWSRYRKSVRSSRWAYKAKEIIQQYGIAVLYPGSLLPPEVQIAIGIVFAVAGLFFIGGWAASVAITIVTEAGKYRYQKYEEARLKEAMAKEAAVEAVVTATLEAKIDALIEKLSKMEEELAILETPKALREAARTAQEEGAPDIQVRALFLLADKIEAYVQKTGKLPPKAWYDVEVSPIFRDLQKADIEAMNMIDEAIQEAAVIEAAPAAEPIHPVSLLVPSPVPSPVPLPAAAPFPVPLLIAAAAFWFLTR